MSEYDALHCELERRIAGLLTSVEQSLTPDERGEVLQFLDVAEYGLALETLFGILVEGNKPIEARVQHEFDELSRAMRLGDEREDIFLR